MRILSVRVVRKPCQSRECGFRSGCAGDGVVRMYVIREGDARPVTVWGCTSCASQMSNELVQAAMRKAFRWYRSPEETMEAECDAFNEAYPVGTSVRYWTGLRAGDGELSRTRTTARILSGHTTVVWVEGHAACIALSHVQPVGSATTMEEERVGIFG